MSGPRIPETDGVSGTFAALERTSPIVQVADGVPTTTSMRIANGTRTEHRAVLQLIQNNFADFDEFGGVAFEMQPFDTAGGVQHRRVAILNEGQATLLLTYMRNNEIVKDFKKRLVREFFTMRQQLTGPVAPMTGPELVAAALIEATQMLEQREARIHQLEQKVTTDAPKVTYVDTYVTDADLLSFSTVASTNGVKESELRDLLIRKGWIYVQEETRWSNAQSKKVTRYRYTEKADKKRYFRRVEVHEAPRFRGEVMHTLKITPRGAEAVARLVAKEPGSLIAAN